MLNKNKKLTVKNITKYGMKSLPITFPSITLAVLLSLGLNPSINKYPGYLHTKIEITSEDIENPLIKKNIKQQLKCLLNQKKKIN